MYTVFAVETTTGQTLGTIPCVIRNWADPLGGSPTAQVDLNPGTLTVQTRDWYRLITTPWRSSLVIDWDGTAVWAGPILPREFDGTKTTVSAAGFRGLMDGRKIHDWSTDSNGNPDPAWKATYTGVSLGQIAINLVQLATAAGKPGAELPIILPTGETDTDPTHVRTYNGYELKNVGTELDNLTASLNGPDIHFMPQWTDTTRSNLQWVMRVGTLEQPQLFSPAKVMFDASSPRSGVQKITEKEDGSLLTTTEWAEGVGNTVGTLMSRYTSTALTSLGWPLLESQIDYKTVSSQSTLNAHAQADQELHAVDTLQWTLEVDAQQPPTLGSFLLGDKAFVRVASHVWIPDSPPGGYPVRVIGISGDNTPTVKLDVQ